MICQQDKNFLRLIERSPDCGDGWRSVSAVVWPLVEQFETPELIEIDKPGMRVRPTESGQAVIDFAL